MAELIAKLTLTVANKGKIPTFANSRGQKNIIDITVTNKKGNRNASINTSLSDHRLISFDIDFGNSWEC